MENTGVIRKIDELGRIVIPKEIRKQLKIYDDDYLEIYISKDCISLKKHSQIQKLSSFAQQLTDLVYSFTNKEIFIADKYKIIAYSGNKKSSYLNKETSKQLIESIKRRESIMQNHIKPLTISTDGNEIKCSFVTNVIISMCDSIGIIVMYSEDKLLNVHDMNVIEILSSFLNKYLEE